MSPPSRPMLPIAAFSPTALPLASMTSSSHVDSASNDDETSVEVFVSVVDESTEVSSADAGRANPAVAMAAAPRPAAIRAMMRFAIVS